MGITWVPWNHLATPKRLGGTGILNLSKHMMAHRFSLVQSLPVSLFRSTGFRSSFLRIGALLPTLALLLVFLATIRAFHDCFPLANFRFRLYCHGHTNCRHGRSTDDGATSDGLRTWNQKQQGQKLGKLGFPFCYCNLTLWPGILRLNTSKDKTLRKYLRLL